MASNDEAVPISSAQAGGRRVATGSYNPLADLNDTHSSLYQQLRKNVDESDFPAHIKTWLTPNCLCRYLRACSWNLKNAEKMLRDTAAWRIESKPEALSRDELALEAQSTKMYVNGAHDKFGRPLIMMRPVRDNTGSEHRVAKVNYLVWCMERAITNMDEDAGVEKLVQIVDMTGMRVAMNHDMKITRDCMHILQNHYPERLGVAYFVNPPWLFWGFWKIISPFIDPVTREKIKFIKDLKDPAGKAELLQIFEPSQLEPDYGGTSKWTYDHEAWLRGDDTGSKGAPPRTTLGAPTLIPTPTPDPETCPVSPKFDL